MLHLLSRAHPQKNCFNCSDLQGFCYNAFWVSFNFTLNACEAVEYGDREIRRDNASLQYRDCLPSSAL